MRKHSKKNVNLVKILDFKTNNLAWMTFINWKTSSKIDS